MKKTKALATTSIIHMFLALAPKRKLDVCHNNGTSEYIDLKFVAPEDLK